MDENFKKLAESLKITEKSIKNRLFEFVVNKCLMDEFYQK